MAVIPKRILKDIAIFKRQLEELNNSGIFCQFTEENLLNAKAMIIGPSETPYENGYYFFDIWFPKDYPLNPPKVTFMNQDKRCRFNPNLYTNGKVCVSILGTWSGPGWTSCLNICSVLLSIQSLLNSRPIQNEPGWENENGARHLDYNNVVEYYNYHISMRDVLNKPIVGYEMFHPIMIDYFVKNFKNIYQKLNQNIEEKDYKVVNSSIYSLSAVLNYTVLRDDLVDLYKKHKKDEDDSFLEQVVVVDKTEISSSKTKSRKAPNTPAKNFELGFIMKSENDGNNYIVKGTNVKKWYKCKDQ